MLPHVQPIAPVRRQEPFDDPAWLFDLKYDGFRALGDKIAASLGVNNAKQRPEELVKAARTNA